METITKPFTHKPDSSRFIYLVFALGLLTVGLIPTFLAALVDSEQGGSLVVVHLVTVGLIAVIFGMLNVKAAILILILILPWQPFLSMPFADVLGSAGVRLLVSTKEVFVTSLFAVLLLKRVGRFRWQIVDFFSIVFLLVYIISGITSKSNLTEVVVSFREGFMIVAFYWVGRLTLFEWKDIHWLLRTIVIASLIVAGFGYLERFVFTSGIWNEFGVNAYMGAKYGIGKPGAIIYEGLPRQWFTYVAGERPRRMVGPIGDAPSLSRFLSFSILTLVYVKGILGNSRSDSIIRWASIIFLSGALIFTLGRGGAVIILGGILVWLFFRYPVLAISVGLPSIAIILLESSFLNWQSPSAVRHITGLSRGVESLQDTLLGHGLGSSGQLAVLYSAGELIEVTESYIGGLTYQMGLFGIVTYFLFAFTTLFLLFRIYKKVRFSRKKPGEVASMTLLAFTVAGGVFVTSMLANSAVAPISGGLPLLYAGAVISAYQHNKSSQQDRA